MAHNLYIDENNRAAMAYRPENGTPWHGLGNHLFPGMTLDQEAELAGFNFTVESSPVFYNGNGSPQVSTGNRVFFRSDKPGIVLGINSDQFKPVQPRECLEFFHALSNETGCELDTAGVLGEGEKFWALAKTGDATEIKPGDGKTESFLLIATANNGTMATRIQPTAVRVVCQNTLSAAMSKRAAALSINHRSRVNWANVRDWVQGEREDFALYTEIMREFANIPIGAEQAADFSARLISPEWDRKGDAPRSLKRFVSTLQSGQGQAEAGRNAYGLINAVTRYADHEIRAQSQATRLNSAWFGAGNTLKQTAMETLIRDCVTKWGARDQLAPVLAETKFAELLAA